MSWKWMAAKATGTSHVRTGKGCDDAYACYLSGPDRDFLVAIACDGAGSAAFGNVGAQRTVRRLVVSIHKWLLANGSIPPDANIRKMLSQVQNEIAELAMCRSAEPRDFATTLVLAICGPEQSAFVHVGDGAALVHHLETDIWECIHWPQQGEYAGQTAFLTDTPVAEIDVQITETAFDQVILFTDGMERLLLDFSTKTANQATFASLTRPLQTVQMSGHQAALSTSLAGLLDSPAVNSRTDDDKTLVIAARTQ